MGILYDERRVISLSDAETFLAGTPHDSLYQQIVTYLTSGESRILCLEHPNAVVEFRKLVGLSDPVEAKAKDPNSLRGRFGTDYVHNAIHASVDGNAAAFEVALFFPEVGFEVVTVDTNVHSLSYPSNSRAPRPDLTVLVSKVTENTVVLKWLPPVLCTLRCWVGDSEEGRVACEPVHSSEAYAEFTELSTGQIYTIEVAPVPHKGTYEMTPWRNQVMPLPPVQKLYVCAATRRGATLSWSCSNGISPGPVTIDRNAPPGDSIIPRFKEFETVSSDAMDMICSLCYTITDNNPGTRYFFRVFNGPQQMHETVGRMTEFKLPNTRITDITVCSDDEGSLTLFWKFSAEFPPEPNHRITIESKPTPFDPFDTWYMVAENMDADSITIEKLTPGQHYMFRVWCSGDPEGAVVCGAGLYRITNLRVKEVRAGTVVLEWSKSPGSTRYAVEMKRKNDDKWNMIVDDLEAEEVEVHGLYAGSQYEFRVTPGLPMSLAGVSLSATISATVKGSNTGSDRVPGRHFEDRRTVSGKLGSPTIDNGELASYAHVENKVNCWMSPEILEMRREKLKQLKSGGGGNGSTSGGAFNMRDHPRTSKHSCVSLHSKPNQRAEDMMNMSSLPPIIREHMRYRLSGKIPE
eukprot:c2760_g1_i1.p1 GENE.c2760_g1_i1~~c2760_g1_i1.p1  ORF type:complete len:735 (-),score=163.07 c2760_g1_i1:100-1998(-)